jgi:hypothetical protein
MTIVTETATVGNQAPNVVVVDPSPIHLREYDFEAGDERFFDREEAIAKAMLRVKDRGCRQQVRITAGPLVGGLNPLWLVQDI